MFNNREANNLPIIMIVLKLGVGVGSFEMVTAPASVFGFLCGALKLSLYRNNGQTGVDMYIRIEDNQNNPSPMIKVR